MILKMDSNWNWCFCGNKNPMTITDNLEKTWQPCSLQVFMYFHRFIFTDWSSYCDSLDKNQQQQRQTAVEQSSVQIHPYHIFWYCTLNINLQQHKKLVKVLIPLFPSATFQDKKNRKKNQLHNCDGFFYPFKIK